MKILALESSALVASVAITDDDKLLASSTLDNGHTHSETLLPMIEHLMSLCDIDASDIDLFAVTNGPGSFTGVRIGVSLVKGLAFGRKKPCAAISSLEALAYNMEGCIGVLCPVMDARRSQLYNALFYSDGKQITRLTDDRLIPAADLLSELERYAEECESIYVNGEGTSILFDVNGESIPLLEPALIARRQSAASVAKLAHSKYLAGEVCSDSDLLPAYLRPSQAERERMEKENQTN